MNKYKKWITICLVSFTITGCTELTTIGTDAHIICYSGGKVILIDESSGIITSEKNSDGWFYTSKKDNKSTRISGDCVIKI